MARTLAIRWHMRTIRIWEILVNYCILSMLAFEGYMRHETDRWQCIQAVSNVLIRIFSNFFENAP